MPHIRLIEVKFFSTKHLLFNSYFKVIKLSAEKFVSISMATAALAKSVFKLKTAWITLYIDYLLLPINSCVPDIVPINEVIYFILANLLFFNRFIA